MFDTRVAEPRHRASDASAKTFSEDVERPRRGWLRKRQPQEPEAAAQRSTFPQPARETQILPTVPAAPQVLYRERPIDLDKAACNISLVATSATLHRHSAIRLEEELAVHLRVVHALAQRERAEGLKLLERPGNAAAATGEALESLQNVAEAERKANELPNVKVTAEVDTDTFGADLGAVWTNALAVNDATAQFQKITPGMPDPRVTVKVEQIEQVPATASRTAAGLPSPVHVDGTTPPVPDEVEVADPGAAKPLPRRHPVDVLPASDRDPYLSLDPADPDADIERGSWLFDEGCGSTGPVWLRVADRRIGVDAKGVYAVLLYAGDLPERECRAGGRVRVLDPQRAKELLAQHEAELAAKRATERAA